MKGQRSWNAGSFHPDCDGVTVVDIAGFAHLWCPRCHILANLEAVAPKHEDYEASKRSNPPLTLKKQLLKGGE